MTSNAEVVIALYFTLMGRNECYNCGGSGQDCVEIDGEMEPDICTCVQDVEDTLEQYKDEIDKAINAYLREKGYKPEKLAQDIKKFTAELLGMV